MHHLHPPRIVLFFLLLSLPVARLSVESSAVRPHGVRRRAQRRLFRAPLEARVLQKQADPPHACARATQRWPRASATGDPGSAGEPAPPRPRSPPRPDSPSRDAPPAPRPCSAPTRRGSRGASLAAPRMQDARRQTWRRRASHQVDEAALQRHARLHTSCTTDACTRASSPPSSAWSSSKSLVS